MSRSLVLDASALVELLLRTPTGARVAARLARRGLHVPHLADVEVAQVLRRYVRLGSIAASDAEAALADLIALDLVRHGHDLLLPRVWQLRDNATAYDAVYLALAEGLGATLLTCDAKLRAVPGCTADVDVM